MNNSFKDMGIAPPILKALNEMGFDEPTEVQRKAIPHILNNKDIIVTSKTGSGKTAVFGVSMLQMIDPGAPGPQGLILTPARELAVQVDSDIKQISKYVPHRTTAIYGQHNMSMEIQDLKNGVSIVTGTPGRVYDHICHGTLVTKNIHFLVLDEADRMLDMGFIDQVTKIIKTLPKNRITLLFSATIPPIIKRICSSHMKNPVTIELESDTKTVDTIEQVYYRVNASEKRTQLNRVLLAERPDNCMIFCNTRIAVDRVQNFLSEKGYGCQALHGDIPQGRRLGTMQRFKKGGFHILVATDVAARGIHIEGLSLVINYDVPNERDSYIHRIGRTGRAGLDGKAISLVTVDDIMSLYEIEEHIGALILESEPPTDEYLSKHEDDIELWIKSNSFKSKPILSELGSKVRGASRKPSITHTRVSENKNRKEIGESNKATVSLRNIEHSRRNATRQTRKPVSNFNTTQTDRPASNLNSKRSDRPVSDLNSKQAGRPVLGLNGKRSDRLVSDLNSKQAKRPISGLNSKQADRPVSNFNKNQSVRTNSIQRAGQAGKNISARPVLNRAKAENSKTKTGSHTEPIALSTAQDNSIKKEQHFLKRVLNRMLGIK